VKEKQVRKRRLRIAEENSRGRPFGGKAARVFPLEGGRKKEKKGGPRNPHSSRKGVKGEKEKAFVIWGEGPPDKKEDIQALIYVVMTFTLGLGKKNSSR